MKLRSFRENYVFEGPFDDGFKQVGNAVSPLAAKHLGEFVAAKLSAGRLDSFYVGAPPIEVSGPVGPGFAVTINGIKRRREKLLDAA